MTTKHTWKKLKPTLSNMLVSRRCTACGLQHRRMRYGRAEARRGWTRDEYRQRTGERWAGGGHYKAPACSARVVCPMCNGAGTVHPKVKAGDVVTLNAPSEDGADDGAPMSFVVTVLRVTGDDVSYRDSCGFTGLAHVDDCEPYKRLELA